MLNWSHECGCNLDRLVAISYDCLIARTVTPIRKTGVICVVLGLSCSGITKPTIHRRRRYNGMHSQAICCSNSIHLLDYQVSVIWQHCLKSPLLPGILMLCQCCPQGVLAQNTIGVVNGQRPINQIIVYY